MSYTDDTILSFGKHKWVSLCRVPADYLLKIHANKCYHNPEIREYIESNIERIRARKEGVIETPPFEFPCTKITYISQKQAKEALATIRQTNQEHKKPIREYECEKCGGWHLTSKIQ